MNRLNLPQRLRESRVLPVLTIHHEEDAVPLARALAAGGARSVEITLRTPAALVAISALRRELPDLLVGAGTILDAEDLGAACAAGAQFAVSPGLEEALASAALEQDVPFVPGVMTPSEVMRARQRGWRLLKLFPAEVAGGVALLRALQGPLADIAFCPTGGIDAQSAESYLSLKNVVCVGGSWMAPESLIRARDWSAIRDLTAEALS